MAIMFAYIILHFVVRVHMCVCVCLKQRVRYIYYSLITLTAKTLRRLDISEHKVGAAHSAGHAVCVGTDWCPVSLGMQRLR